MRGVLSLLLTSVPNRVPHLFEDRYGNKNTGQKTIGHGEKTSETPLAGCASMGVLPVNQALQVAIAALVG